MNNKPEKAFKFEICILFLIKKVEKSIKFQTTSLKNMKIFNVHI